MSQKKFEFLDFEWSRTLGEGSYGVVVLARLKDGRASAIRTREFAVKKLSKHFIQRENLIQRRGGGGRDVLGQVMNERDLLRKLNKTPSPFVVTLYGTFHTKDELFYVLSYQNRGDLRELLNDKAALELDTAKFYMAEIFSALFYLHDNSVIHRDMKPENILLGDTENGIHIKLCDFATAKDVSDGEMARTFVGSAEYISPELLGCDKENGKYTCFESDIWAAGCIAYFMLSGLPPFQGDGEYATFRKVESIDYFFPRGFHEGSKSFIESIFVMIPSERIGGNRNHDQIKSHHFFKGIEWDTLENQKPPPILTYFDKAEDAPEDQFGGCQLRAELNSFEEKLSFEENHSQPKDPPKDPPVNDPEGLGIPLILPQAKYDKLLKDQKLNRDNIANRWNTFVNDELIVKLGYMDKKRGLFPRKRMFLLTGGRANNVSRLVYVDANKWEKKGEITFHKDVSIKQLSFSRFHIIDPHIGRDGRIYDLIDKTSNNGINAGAVQWIKKLKELMGIYFPQE